MAAISGTGGDLALQAASTNYVANISEMPGSNRLGNFLSSGVA